MLDAAEKLFLEKGFRATSVHDIANDAGYTTGAIYSSFNGKDDLFLAVAERHQAQQEQVWRDAVDSAANSERVAAAMGVALTKTMPKPAWIAVFLEFLSFASRDPELRDKAERVSGYRLRGAIVTDLLKQASASSPLPLNRLAEIVSLLMHGVTVASFADPEAADPTLFSDAVAVLLGAAPGGPDSASRS